MADNDSIDPQDLDEALGRPPKSAPATGGMSGSTPSPQDVLTGTQKPKETPQTEAPGDPQVDVLNKLLETQGQLQEDIKKQQEVMLPYYRQINDQIQANINFQRNNPLPQPPANQQIPQEDRHALGSALLGYAALAIPLAILMGSKGGAFSAAAIGGFGMGIKSLMDARHQAYNDAFDRAQAIDQQQGIHYNQQMNQYKEILANQKLTVDQMMSQVENVSKIYGNKPLADLAERKFWDEMLNHMGKMEDAQRKRQEFDLTRGDKLQTTTMKDYGLWFWQRNHFYPFAWDANTPQKAAALKKDSYDYYLRNVKRKPEDTSEESSEKSSEGAKGGSAQEGSAADDADFKSFFGLDDNTGSQQ